MRRLPVLRPTRTRSPGTATSEVAQNGGEGEGPEERRRDKMGEILD